MNCFCLVSQENWGQDPRVNSVRNSQSDCCCHASFPEYRFLWRTKRQTSSGDACHEIKRTQTVKSNFRFSLSRKRRWRRKAKGSCNGTYFVKAQSERSMNWNERERDLLSWTLLSSSLFEFNRQIPEVEMKRVTISPGTSRTQYEVIHTHKTDMSFFSFLSLNSLQREKRLRAVDGEGTRASFFIPSTSYLFISLFSRNQSPLFFLLFLLQLLFRV